MQGYILGLFVQILVNVSCALEREDCVAAGSDSSSHQNRYHKSKVVELLRVFPMTEMEVCQLILNQEKVTFVACNQICEENTLCEASADLASPRQKYLYTAAG
jgi:hypothetical protein